MIKEIQTPFIILRRKQAESRIGLSRSTIYARIAEGSLPHPVNLGGGRAVGWIESEINEWVQARIEQSRKTI